jgi:enoyl-CoA hydratase
MGEAVREVEREEAGGVVVLRLSRPPVNALWSGILAELRTALEREEQAGTSGIVLTGAGRCFSAGIDTKLAAVASAEEQRVGVAAINALVTTLFGLSRPVVAAVNGHALGGGLVIPLACDLLIATREQCTIGLNEVAAGVPFPAAPLAAVRARLAPPVFNNLCLTGRTFGPEEALALGVADELCDAAELLPRAVALAAQLGAFEAYARVKRQVRGPQLAEMELLAREDPMLERWVGPAGSAGR